MSNRYQSVSKRFAAVFFTLASSMLSCMSGAYGATTTESADPGSVHFMLHTSSAFDAYTLNPSATQQDWMRKHFWRLVTFSPYFDQRLRWFLNGMVYFDSYAIYLGSADAKLHPEWILKDSSGRPLFIPWGCSNGSCPQYAADVSNTAYRAHWIQQAQAYLNAGYRGLWIDDVNLEMRISDNNGNAAVPVDPGTGLPMSKTSWEKYFADFMSQVRAAFPNKPIVHNAIWFAGNGISDPYVQQEIKAADWINLERGLTDPGLTNDGGPFSLTAFFRYIDYVHSVGRHVNLQQYNFDGEYSIAGYFLMNDGLDSLGNDAVTPNSWPLVYNVSLGNPLGSRYTWNGLLRRDFERGVVLLNPPGSRTATVVPLGDFTDSTGSAVGSVTLSAREGKVLQGTPAFPKAPAAVKVNVCGASVQDFQADGGVTGGHCDTFKTLVNLNTPNAAPQEVYQSKRTTNSGKTGFTYSVSNLVPKHAYTVRLHNSWSSGRRVFNVFVNGALAVANLDIYKLSGTYLKAVVITVPAVLPDSQNRIVLNFQNGNAGNALANGIEILP